MNSLILRTCRQVCRRCLLTSTIPQHNTSINNLNSRFLRLWPALYQHKDNDLDDFRRLYKKSVQFPLTDIQVNEDVDTDSNYLLNHLTRESLLHEEKNLESEEPEKPLISVDASEETDFDEDRDAELGEFSKFDISEEGIQLLRRAGVNYFFEVQYKTYEAVRDGTDVFVQARTGTGKTLAFAIPLLERLRTEQLNNRRGQRGRPPSVMCLAPTRELAIQIAKEFEKFSSRHISVSCFYGGSSYDYQERGLRMGTDILIGTPGRILDHLNRGNLDLSRVQHMILDEADRMLDMGFQKDIEKILSFAYTGRNKPQTLLFSATLPNWVENITRRYTSDNMQRFDFIGDMKKSALLVDHKLIRCTNSQHAPIIGHLLQKYCGEGKKAIVFAETKKNVAKIAMDPRLQCRVGYITGDLSQQQRETTLSDFKGGRINCLVATDVAARGLDIPEIDLVIQTQPPNDSDYFIHRVGRTGRAGSKGVSVLLCHPLQKKEVRSLERTSGISFEEIVDDKIDDILMEKDDDDDDYYNHIGGRRDGQGGFGSDRPVRHDRRNGRGYDHGNRHSYDGQGSRGGFERKSGRGGFERQSGRGGFERQSGQSGFERQSGRGGFERRDGRGGFDGRGGRGRGSYGDQSGDRRFGSEGLDDYDRGYNDRGGHGGRYNTDSNRRIDRSGPGRDHGNIDTRSESIEYRRFGSQRGQDRMGYREGRGTVRGVNRRSPPDHDESSHERFGGRIRSDKSSENEDSKDSTRQTFYEFLKSKNKSDKPGDDDV